MSTDTPTPDRAPDDAQPSAEAARKLAAEVINAWLEPYQGSGPDHDPDFDHLEDAFTHALDRFAAARVRELQAAINTILEDPILDDEARLADIAEIVTDWSGLERGEMQ